MENFNNQNLDAMKEEFHKKITTGYEAQRTDESKDKETTYKVNNDFENYTVYAEDFGNMTVLNEHLGPVNKLEISRLIRIEVNKRLNKENDSILDVSKQLTETIKTGLPGKVRPVKRAYKLMT